jgi:hypothetical protein
MHLIEMFENLGDLCFPVLELVKKSQVFPSSRKEYGP